MKTLWLCLLIIWATVAFGASISLTEAQQVAINWITKWSENRQSAIEVASTQSISADNATVLYLVKFAGGGFVIVSGDDRIIPIIGYSPDAEANDWMENESFASYLNLRRLEIKSIINSASNEQTANEQWQEILSRNFSRYSTRSVIPLIQTRWNQGWPYNMLCPTDPNGPGGHVYAGCVATAMSQVMKFWNWPPTGVGSHSYNASGYGNQSANFGQTTYLWDQMPNVVGTPNDPVARLQYHCGVAVNMMYSPTGSGAYSGTAASSLRQYFRYANNLSLLDKDSYSNSTWESMLREQLDNVKPLYYHGYGDAGGHAFVCDGYQADNYFHFNWGWSGSYDGYFYLNNLSPGTSFTSGQGAIFDVIPIGYNISMAQIGLSTTDCSAGDEITLDVITNPLLPDWNITNASFILQYEPNCVLTGYETENTISSGGTVSINQLGEGMVGFNIDQAGAIHGAGSILKIKFRILEPSEYTFSLASFSYNSTAVTDLRSVTINAVAEISDIAQSQIDVQNAMHIAYNSIAHIPIKTTYIMPSWNVHQISLSINYPPDKLAYNSYTGSSWNTTFQGTYSIVEDTPGHLSVEINSTVPISNSGNFLDLQFAAIGTSSSVSLAVIDCVSASLNNVALTNISDGYVVLLPVTANQDETIVPLPTLQVFPNPFRNDLTFSVKSVEMGKAELVIYNIKGQVVSKQQYSLNKGINDIKLNASEGIGKHASGIYFYRLRINHNTFNGKLLKL